MVLWDPPKPATYVYWFAGWEISLDDGWGYSAHYVLHRFNADGLTNGFKWFK